MLYIIWFGINITISGTYVITIKIAMLTKIYAMVCLLTTVSTGSFVKPAATYKFKPNGGVAQPIARLMHMMTPKCTGSIPKFPNTDDKIGAKIRIAAVVSM